MNGSGRRRLGERGSGQRWLGDGGEQELAGVREKLNLGCAGGEMGPTAQQGLG
jgi:hypothetical protein